MRHMTLYSRRVFSLAVLSCLWIPTSAFASGLWVQNPITKCSPSGLEVSATLFTLPTEDGLKKCRTSTYKYEGQSQKPTSCTKLPGGTVVGTFNFRTKNCGGYRGGPGEVTPLPNPMPIPGPETQIYSLQHPATLKDGSEDFARLTKEAIEDAVEQYRGLILKEDSRAMPPDEALQAAQDFLLSISNSRSNATIVEALKAGRLGEAVAAVPEKDQRTFIQHMREQDIYHSWGLSVAADASGGIAFGADFIGFLHPIKAGEMIVLGDTGAGSSSAPVISTTLEPRVIAFSSGALGGGLSGSASANLVLHLYKNENICAAGAATGFVGAVGYGIEGSLSATWPDPLEGRSSNPADFAISFGIGIGAEAEVEGSYTIVHGRTYEEGIACRAGITYAKSQPR